ncbi:MAG: hypothetical protein MHPSP_003749, partial [Paramarteilia canceri]
MAKCAFNLKKYKESASSLTYVLDFINDNGFNDKLKGIIPIICLLVQAILINTDDLDTEIKLEKAINITEKYLVHFKAQYLSKKLCSKDIKGVICLFKIFSGIFHYSSVYEMLSGLLEDNDTTTFNSISNKEIKEPSWLDRIYILYEIYYGDKYNIGLSYDKICHYYRSQGNNVENIDENNNEMIKYFNRGNLQKDKSNFVKAKENFEKVLRLAKNNYAESQIKLKLGSMDLLNNHVKNFQDIE